MRIGSLRHRVIIQQPTRSANNTGGSAYTFSDVASVSAEVIPLTAYERAQALQAEMESTHKMTIRYRPDVDNRMRVLFRSRAFDIVGIKNVDERNQWLELRTLDRGPV